MFQDRLNLQRRTLRGPKSTVTERKGHRHDDGFDFVLQSHVFGRSHEDGGFQDETEIEGGDSSRMKTWSSCYLRLSKKIFNKVNKGSFSGSSRRLDGRGGGNTTEIIMGMGLSTF